MEKQLYSLFVCFCAVFGLWHYSILGAAGENERQKLT